MTTCNAMFFSKTAFREYLGIGDAVFRTMVNAGMPARCENGRWYISLNNFQAWFDRWAAVRSSGDDLEIEGDGDS